MILKEARASAVVFFVALLLVLTVISLDRVEGDGCYIPMSVEDIFEPGQNAIIAWNGTYERMILSVDIRGEKGTQGFHMIPFPSYPTVTLGNRSIFSNLTHVLDWKMGDPLYDGKNDVETTGFQVLFQSVLGAHNVTVIRITDYISFQSRIDEMMRGLGSSIEQWPKGLDAVIENYTKRGCEYFTIDQYAITNRTASIEPLVFEFETDSAYFPLEISSPMKGSSSLNLAVFLPPELKYNISGRENGIEITEEFMFTGYDLCVVGDNFSSLFDDGAIFLLFEGNVELNDLRGDLIIKPYGGETWEGWGDQHSRSEILKMGEGYDDRLLYYWLTPHTDGDGLTCISPIGLNNVLWEYPVDPRNVPLTHRIVIAEDLDGIKGDELIVVDTSFYGWLISRLDPIDGKIIWTTLFEDGPEYYWSLYNGFYLGAQPITGPEGKDHFLLSGSIVIDLDNGSVINRLSKSSIGVHSTMQRVPMESGDLLLEYNREIGLILHDPWDLENTTRFERSMDHINWMFPIIHGNESFIFLNGLDDELSGNIILDPIGGWVENDWKEGSSHRLVWDGNGDIDGDGDTELLYVERVIQNKYVIFSVEAISGDVEWSVSVNYPWNSIPNWHRMIKLYLNNDTLPELLFYTDKGYVTLISGNSGYEILKDDYMYLGSGFDWNDNGVKDIIIANNTATLIFDPTTQTILATLPLAFHHKNSIFIGIQDWDDDGKEELYFHYRDLHGHCLEKGEDEWYQISPGYGLQWYYRGGRFLYPSLDYVDNFNVGLVERRGEDHLGFFTNSSSVEANGSIMLTLDLHLFDGEIGLEDVEIHSTLKGSHFSNWTMWREGIYNCEWFPNGDKTNLASVYVKVDVFKEIILMKSLMISVRSDHGGPDYSELYLEYEVDKDRMLPGETVMISVDASITLPVSGIDVEMIEIQGFGTELTKQRVDDGNWTFTWTAPFDLGTVVWLLRVTVNDTVAHEELISITVTGAPVERDPFMEIYMPYHQSLIKPGGNLTFGARVMHLENISIGSIEIDDGGAGGSITNIEEISAGYWRFEYLVPDIETVHLNARFMIDGENILSSSYKVHVTVEEEEQEPKINGTNEETLAEGDDDEEEPFENTSNDNLFAGVSYTILAGISSATVIILIITAVIIINRGPKKEYEE